MRKYELQLVEEYTDPPTSAFAVPTIFLSKKQVVHAWPDVEEIRNG